MRTLQREQPHDGQPSAERASRRKAWSCRIQGLGTFAAQPASRLLQLTEIRDIHEEILARGHVHDARVHIAREERAKGNTVAARLFARARGAPVFHTLIVHCENGVPIQCEDRYVNPAAAPAYLQRRLHAHGHRPATCWKLRRYGRRSIRSRLRCRLRRKRACWGIAQSDPCPPRRRAPHRKPACADHRRTPRAPGNPLLARRSVQTMSSGTRYLLEGQSKTP